MIPLFEQAKTVHALDRTATVIEFHYDPIIMIIKSIHGSAGKMRGKSEM
jgi:hypothetical protein